MENDLKEKLNKVLFHGTLMDRAANIIIDGIDYTKLNDRADFGKGFYTTDSYALAKTTAITRYYEALQSSNNAYLPVVIKLKIVRKNILNYKIKEFYGDSLEWKRFICCDRWYNEVIKRHPEYDNNYHGKYDIVIGLTADGNLGKLGKLIKEDEYNLSNDCIKSLKPFITSFIKQIGNKTVKQNTKAYQISFHNKKLISDYIKFKDYNIIFLDKEDESYE